MLSVGKFTRCARLFRPSIGRAGRAAHRDDSLRTSRVGACRDVGCDIEFVAAFTPNCPVIRLIPASTVTVVLAGIALGLTMLIVRGSYSSDELLQRVGGGNEQTRVG